MSNSLVVEIQVPEGKYKVKIPVSVSKSLGKILIGLVNERRFGYIGFYKGKLEYNHLLRCKFAIKNLVQIDLEEAKQFPNSTSFTGYRK